MLNTRLFHALFSFYKDTVFWEIGNLKKQRHNFFIMMDMIFPMPISPERAKSPCVGQRPTNKNHPLIPKALKGRHP